MRVVSVVGARPQFVKLAPVSQEFERRGIEHIIVHTGQHYEHGLSGAFFDDLGIAAPDANLEIGSGSHGAQTGAILSALEPLLQDRSPDWVLVYGDTNSTLAAALAAVKLHLPLAHLEAGLRSFNRRMPEEHNRVLTDHAADICLAPTDLAVKNLRLEGLAGRTRLVGDVMADVCLRTRDGLSPELIDWAEKRAGSVLATLHRAENTDDPDRLGSILVALQAIDGPVILPVHPRLRDRCRAFGLKIESGSVTPVDPLSYPQLVALVSRARAVVTDSGGLQKEAFLLRTPCVTVRTETEWPETLAGGWNVLSPDVAHLLENLNRVPTDEDPGAPYGDGHAAGAVADALEVGPPMG